VRGKRRPVYPIWVLYNNPILAGMPTNGVQSAPVATHTRVSKDDFIKFRLPRDLADDLRRVAQDEERSLSAELRLAIKRHVARHDQRELGIR
jgi:hypothetical protein